MDAVVIVGVTPLNMPYFSEEICATAVMKRIANVLMTLDAKLNALVIVTRPVEAT